MLDRLRPAMRRALAAVRASDPMAATAIIQAALRGTPEREPASGKPQESAPASARGSAPRRMSLGETLAKFRNGPDVRPPRPGQEPELPDGSAFLKRSITTFAGSRNYRLFVPSSGNPRGLIVMLHGCKQNAEDFATGTAMNIAAENENMLVAYPTQALPANSTGCWNWFRPEDQGRGTGEPHIIAEMTRAILSEYGLGETACVAGLSAGGAMTAVMGATYPDLYEAIGIHSGLPYRSAGDVSSALAAMRGHLADNVHPSPAAALPRQIVFHGSRDHIVVPANAQALMDGARRSCPSAQAFERRFTSGSREVRHTELVARDGSVKAEAWLIDGAGHYWSGGDPKGSFAKPDGPSASAEMMRFFLGRRYRG